MTVNDRKVDLACLNKLRDQYYNNYHHSINKNILMLIILLWLRKLRQILKLPIFKLMIESESLL